MPEVRPFYGWRYHPERVDLRKVVAPPYDVVSPEEVLEYLQRDPYNIFHLELSREGPDPYLRAAEKLNRWIAEGILVREDRPSLYIYRLHFSHEGRNYVRTGFIGLVRLSPFSEGRILPHEKTFPRVTEDRLNLLRATSAQFSQIFALYHDPGLRTLKLARGEPLFRLETPSGEVHELARLTDPALQEELSAFWHSRPFYIADGHHRYTTALKYAREMEARLRPEGPRCFHYLMMYLCPFEEPGLLVLPTHRVIRRSLPEERLKATLHRVAEVEEISCRKPPALGERTLLILTRRKTYAVRLRPEVLARWEEETGLPESELPAAWCARLIEGLWGETEKELKEKGLLDYTPWPQEVEREVSKGATAFLLPATPVTVLERVAASGQVMPHKSTYFYPKILTGLVLFRINPEAAPPCP